MFPVFIKRQFKYFILILLCNFLPLLAQNVPVNFKILGISVEGNKTADAVTIIANSGLKIGDEIQLVADQNIMNAIKQLWTLNLFSDINVDVDKQVADGVFLLIKVKEFPRYEKNAFIGNDAESTSDLQAKIDLQRGQILKPQEENKIKNDIIKLYEKDGYLNAEINFENFVYFTADTTKK